MTEPQLVVQDTERTCCICGAALVYGSHVFWQRLEDGSSRAWHQGACDDHQRGTTYGEMRADEDANIDAREAEDAAEDRHLRSLEGE